ncbi:RNA polymerase sigma-70 factor [Mangrovibacterium diazotrophicum]|uniref:RNA polymerase sigma-70 factor (ECF subfamily) n=1 Tax=Mangrovibacterium diazotrophicum TaxID=1261403 RepID=A0A419VXA1_9BACT|nr:RNA polymerase sigma-70 factor [Mangrovibacterium diazotrophicum]RKD87826.1 RNA polymerase sigma-70 factor (ECF subfamily) [Mangrovibacterium diazotrophicum]
MEISDNELTLLLNKGSKNAFATLYERYGRRIYLFALGYLKSDSDAEELVQDVFVKLWERRTSLDEQKNLKAYIFKIVVNTIYDIIRKRNVEQAFLDFAAGKTNNTDDVWDKVVYNDMLTHVNSLVDAMPEQRRKIFKMSKETGLTNDEIAIKLGISKRTVENQLYRATLFLKDNLGSNMVLMLLYYYLFH